MVSNTVGLIDEPEEAKEIAAPGLADVMMLGRALLCALNFPLRATAALGVEVAYAPP